MPADYDDLVSAFADLTGSEDSQSAWYDREVAGAGDWINLFHETGIDFESSAETVGAFEDFLIAFYPQEGMGGDDWHSVREEFYDEYGIDDHNIDWEDYREAIGY